MNPKGEEMIPELKETVFAIAFMKLMDLEGGYGNDPNDLGGETKFGISKRYHPDVDIKNLNISEAKEIYRKSYWSEPGFDKIENSELAQKVFIFAVNAGNKQAALKLQSASNSVGAKLTVDGIIGPKTLGFVNSYRHQISLIAAFKALVNLWYMEKGNKRYIAGWLKRLEV